MSLEYARNRLMITNMSALDHQKRTNFLKDDDVEYNTFNPSPGHNIKLVLKALPTNMACQEIAAGLYQKETVFTM